MLTMLMTVKACYGGVNRSYQYRCLRCVSICVYVCVNVCYSSVSRVSKEVLLFNPITETNTIHTDKTQKYDKIEELDDDSTCSTQRVQTNFIDIHHSWYTTLVLVHFNCITTTTTANS